MKKLPTWTGVVLFVTGLAISYWILREQNVSGEDWLRRSWEATPFKQRIVIILANAVSAYGLGVVIDGLVTRLTAGPA